MTGVVVAVLVTFLRKDRPCLLGRPEILPPRRVLYALLYILNMMRAIILSNLDVAGHILRPRLEQLLDRLLAGLGSRIAG